MFNECRKQQFELYTRAKNYLVKNPDVLIDLEHFFADYVQDLISSRWPAIERDYNEASYLFPFWQHYPPEDRGRKPKGDQYPWIEVGEHAIGGKLPSLLNNDFKVRDTGFPTGADLRFILTSERISELTNGFTNSVWLTIEIKSVGPRDDAPHAVMSHNQVSGDGIWLKPEDGLTNSVMKAVGPRSRHSFYCSIPPLLVLSDKTVAPFVSIVAKPVYKMLSLNRGDDGGQPLERIMVVCIPNGILLLIAPGYLKEFPRLLFPGKDDKAKNRRKKRARIDFGLLSQIADWRVRDIRRPIQASKRG